MLPDTQDGARHPPLRPASGPGFWQHCVTGPTWGLGPPALSGIASGSVVAPATVYLELGEVWGRPAFLEVLPSAFLANPNQPGVPGQRPREPEGQGSSLRRGAPLTLPLLVVAELLLPCKPPFSSESASLGNGSGKEARSLRFCSFCFFLKQGAGDTSECHVAWLGHRIPRSAEKHVLFEVLCVFDVVSGHCL